MFLNRTIKILSNLVFLLILSAGQIAAIPNHGFGFLVNEPAKAAKSSVLFSNTANGYESSLNTSNPIVGNGTTMRDIVLVFDTSGSMAYETDGVAGQGSGDDPSVCNLNNTCQPMKAVKDATLGFLDTLDFPNDRVAVITMTSQMPGGDRSPREILPLTSIKADVISAINGIKVFEPRDCDHTGATEGSCLIYDGNGNFIGEICEILEMHASEAGADPSSCPSSNVGGVLNLARNAFTEYPVNTRPDAFWMAIPLLSGPANATDTVDINYPNGFCPPYTWTYPWTTPSNIFLPELDRYGDGGAWCRDRYPSVRHADDAVAPYTNPVNGDTFDAISIYDADDFARDKADDLATAISGDGVTVFTIGLGAQIKSTRTVAPGEAPAAEALLQYVAECAGEGSLDDCATPVPNPRINHGQYFYAPTKASLVDIFQFIANNTTCSPAIVVTNDQNAGAGSLREAILDVCSGGTIAFDPSLSGGTIYLASSLLIDKGITINGSALASHIQISGDTNNDGTGDVSVFQISGPSIVELNGLDIIKGKAGFANGGGISNLGTLILMNSTISNNSAFLGGGIFNSGNLTISNSNVSGNSAFTGGGGVLNDNGGTITVVNSTISNNSAPNGGGIFNLSTTGTVNISNSTLSGNSVSDNGGGLSNWGTLTATNITLLGNSAAKYGGGIFNLGTSTITNSTISGSSALISGGGVYNANILNYTNTIVANSTSGGDCFNDNPGMINTNTHNLVENNSASPNQCGVPSLISDPKLGVLSDNGGFTQTMALGVGSPAIDAGDDAKCSTTDQRGLTRPQGSHCDMGAYEYRHVIHYVKSNAGGANNGTSWANAYTDLQSALSVSFLSDEIWVAAGTYRPTTDTDRTVSFVLKNGVAVYGGFAGTETLRTQRNSAANVTTLSGEIGAAGIADNSYHVVEGSDIDNTSVLDGFSITAGNGKDVPFQDPWGGGMRVFLGSPTLSNLIFTSNTAYAGGGIVLDNSNSILTNVTFNGNSTSFGGGGGMLVVAGTPTLRNVTFNGNLAESGGGMATSNASPFLENVTFNGNIVSGYGGGMYNGLSDSILKNVTFSGNTAAISGGAIFNDESNPIITNGILWGNTGGEITNILGGSPVVTYSIVQGGYAGTGNLDADPLLGLLANNGGYTQTMALGAGSPAINTGTDIGCPATDQRGVARPQGSHCDIGAYELRPDGTDTAGVFRPSNGLLYLKNANTTGFADVAINYGTGGDYPIAGDWDGNGTATIGIYRNGSFYLRNSNTVGFADIVFAFGTPGDQPVAGDWDGDGVDTIGVYSNGQFLLRNSNSAGTADMSFYLGNPGDVGIAGDWNGDGMDTTGVFRPSNGIIFLKNANTTGFADIALNYGLAGDMPVTGDWNNDGIDTIGVYRNAQFLLRNSNTIGFAEIVFGLGNPGDMPISGNWDGIP